MITKTILNTIKTILFKKLDQKKDKAFIFGSWAIGNNRKFSDIDIGIESTDPKLNNIIMNLKEDFEKSDLPYMVDLVNFKDTTKQFKQVAKQKTISLN
ncbi:MAG: nucleotidyltransferase domain-containing protein [Candidatus Beckwithbacteria bacterium]|nr:nucleotidyltransferase domain-containing protein [Patescibacteria group bacterium]